MIPLLESKRKSIFLAVSSNNGISNIEGQRMSQASANQKIYNSIQRKYIEWAQNLMKERHRDINTQSQNLKAAVFRNI